MPLDLRAIVRDELATSRSADPFVIATQVLTKLDPGDYQAALAATLPDYVRVLAHNTPAPVAVARSGKAWKSSASREWRALLGQRVECGDGERRWKFIADCTRDDLLRAAEQRRLLAAQTVARAEQLERLAALLDEHGVAHVRDLPPDAQGQAAA